MSLDRMRDNLRKRTPIGLKIVNARASGTEIDLRGKLAKVSDEDVQTIERIERGMENTKAVQTAISGIQAEIRAQKSSILGRIYFGLWPTN